MSWRRLEDVLKTSWRRLEDVWPRRIYWSSSRLLEDVLKTSSEDVWVRWIYSSWWRRLLKTKTKDVFKTSSLRRMFVGSILRAYITVHNFDFICLSETYLDSSILHDDDNLQIPGYIIYIGKIILWIFNEEVLAFTTTFLFHFKLKMSITCRNALILK